MYPKNAGPPTHGANEDIPPSEEETFTGFERQIKLRGWRIYRKKIERMKQLGLIEQSNPGNIEQLYSQQFRRIGGWWSDLWKTLGDWIKDIDEWIGPLGTLWDWLVEEGIVTPAQADKGKDEDWTKEQIIELIRLQMTPAWEKYLPWLIGGGLGIGLLAVLLRRPAPVYVAAK